MSSLPLNISGYRDLSLALYFLSIRVERTYGGFPITTSADIPISENKFNTFALISNASPKKPFSLPDSIYRSIENPDSNSNLLMLLNVARYPSSDSSEKNIFQANLLQS